jgi:predicted membrane-bound spermidine synthase
MTNPQKYNKSAINSTIWLIAGALMGGAAGLYMNISGRQIAFFIILGIGVALIILLNQPRSKHVVAVEDKVELEPEKITITEKTELPSASIEQLLQDPNRILTKTEAREWLDSFLAKQQQTK